jgi:ribonuclease PH
MNLVMTQDGQFVEVQGAGEESTFSGTQLSAMLELGGHAITGLIDAQQAALASRDEQV